MGSALIGIAGGLLGGMGGGRRRGGGNGMPQQPPVDPAALIRLQQQLNRPNIRGPFGSQTYGTDAQGNTTFTTELSPQMQGVADNAFSMARQPARQYKPPPGFESLVEMYMQRSNRPRIR